MRTLRTRLILSHTLPLLIILLLTGLTLDYVVETQILLPGFVEELSNEAKLLAEMVSHQTDLWSDPNSAQAYLDKLEPILGPYVTFLDPQGVLLASSDPYLVELAVVPVEILAEILAGDIWIQTAYSRRLEASVVEVFVPVDVPDRDIVGVIQVTYHLENVYGQFLALRRVIIGVLTAGIILGASAALLLALNISNPLQEITLSIRQLATGGEITPHPEQGPEEIRVLIRTVNSLVTQLHNMETTRRKLLANLVHELGRPLGALLPAVQAFQAGVVDNEEVQKEILSGMEDEINILRRLLDDLTGLYDQSVGTFDLTVQPVYLTEWMVSLLQTQRSAAIVKGLHWRQNIPENLPVLKIDPERLAQATGNLINNAIKFTPPGGTVTVEAGIQTNWIWILVQDDGPGITIEEQGNIFTPFYRGQSENRFPQGMGLGLSIASDLIMAHQGRLEFESTPGEGSSFTIWLPNPPEEETV